MASKTGPNEPCPCGSGQKYKRCCNRVGRELSGKARAWRTARNTGIVVGIIGVVLLLSIAGASRGDRSSSNRGSGPVPMPAPAAQPPGPAPPGKVWSPEHGHWHDAPGGLAPFQGGGSPSTMNQRPMSAPQPPGPAPAGKVWSPAHGHWHDAPGAATPPPAEAPAPAAEPETAPAETTPAETTPALAEPAPPAGEAAADE